MTHYFDHMEQEVQVCYDIANKARSKGYDPVDTTEIPLARNMAERVVGLITIVAPQIKDTPVVDRIKELENKYGALDWRVALTMALEVAQQKFCQFETEEEAIEVGIRVGFAYLTLGIVSAPLEGFIGIKIKKRLLCKKSS